MSKEEMIRFLMKKYGVSYRIADEACRDNDWDLMLASGNIRDELSAEA